MALCQEICDPFAPNCIDGEECIYGYPTFLCYPFDGLDLGLFATCEFVTDCAEGLACLPDVAEECEPHKQCCTPICNAANMDPCPGVGQTCLAIEPGFPFTGDLGICANP